MSLGEDVAEIMRSNGLTSVKVYTDDEFAVSVRGGLDTRFVLTFKKENPQSQPYALLNDRIEAQKVMHLPEVTPENLPHIIETAKFFAFPNREEPIQKEPRQKNRPRWVIPAAMGVAFLCTGVSGIYLGQELREHCFDSRREAIQP